MQNLKIDEILNDKFFKCYLKNFLKHKYKMLDIYGGCYNYIVFENRFTYSKPFMVDNFICISVYYSLFCSGYETVDGVSFYIYERENKSITYKQLFKNSLALHFRKKLLSVERKDDFNKLYKKNN